MRTEDDRLPWEPVDNEFCCPGPVGAPRHPGGHVLTLLAPARGERADQGKTCLLLLWQRQRHVVRLHPLNRTAGLLLRDLPPVVPVVEHPWVRDMVGGKDLRLDVEENFRVPEVGGDTGRNIGDRGKEVIEDPSIRIGDGIRRCRAVEGGRAVVGVHNDFDAVAKVVDAPRGGCIGVAIGRRVGVQNPEEPTLVDHDVGIGIKGEEGRDGLRPFNDAATQQDPRVVRNRPAEEHVAILQMRGQDQPGEEISGPDGAAPSTGVSTRLSDLTESRELLLICTDDDPVAWPLPKVDFGPFDGQRAGSIWGEAGDEHRREVLLRHATDGANHDPIPMGVP